MSRAVGLWLTKDANGGTTRACRPTRSAAARRSRRVADDADGMAMTMWVAPVLVATFSRASRVPWTRTPSTWNRRLALSSSSMATGW